MILQIGVHFVIKFIQINFTNIVIIIVIVVVFSFLMLMFKVYSI